MAKLSDIPGVGPSKASILEAKGVHSVEELAVKDAEELKTIIGGSLAGAQKVIKGAKDLLKDSVKIVSASDLQKERIEKIQYISTGSTALDSLFLHGKGVPTDAITAFYGLFASGKTQLCNMLAVNMKKSYGRKTMWVETEPQTLITDRILDIAKANDVEYDLSKDLDIIPAKYMETPNHMFMAYEEIENKLKSGEDIGLIIIDSFNALFRSVYIGRTMLGARSADQGKHIGFLQKLASKYNIAIVLTLQVMGVPDQGTQLGCIKKYGISSPPVASHVLKHGVNYMIGLDQISSVDKTWKAIVADGPVPRGESVFVIDETGVSEFTKRRG